jgi:hypothetical protein
MLIEDIADTSFLFFVSLFSSAPIVLLCKCGVILLYRGSGPLSIYWKANVFRFIKLMSGDLGIIVHLGRPKYILAPPFSPASDSVSIYDVYSEVMTSSSSLFKSPSLKNSSSSI